MIDKKTVEQVALLAKLKISEAQSTEYAQQIAKTLKYFEQISAIPTENIEPLVTPSEIESFWREDVAENEYTAEQMTANAPLKSGNLFKVPPVV